MLILEIAAGVALAPVLWWMLGGIGRGAVWALDRTVPQQPPSPRLEPNIIDRIGVAWIILILGSCAAVGVAALLS